MEMYNLQQIATLWKLPYKVVPIQKYLQLFEYLWIIAEIKHETQPSH